MYLCVCLGHTHSHLHLSQEAKNSQRAILSPCLSPASSTLVFTYPLDTECLSASRRL